MTKLVRIRYPRPADDAQVWLLDVDGQGRDVEPTDRTDSELVWEISVAARQNVVDCRIHPEPFDDIPYPPPADEATVLDEAMAVAVPVPSAGPGKTPSSAGGQGRPEELYGLFEGVPQRLDGLGGRVDTLAGRLDPLASQADAARVSIDDLRRRVGALEHQLETGGPASDETARIAELAAATAATTDTLQGLVQQASDGYADRRGVSRSPASATGFDGQPSVPVTGPSRTVFRLVTLATQLREKHRRFAELANDPNATRGDTLASLRAEISQIAQSTKARVEAVTRRPDSEGLVVDDELVADLGTEKVDEAVEGLAALATAGGGQQS